MENRGEVETIRQTSVYIYDVVSIVLATSYNDSGRGIVITEGAGETLELYGVG